jgi:hypothetical protein
MIKRHYSYFIAGAIWGIPGIPMAFTASFYSGLGPMLVVAAVRFMAAARVA